MASDIAAPWAGLQLRRGTRRCGAPTRASAVWRQRWWYRKVTCIRAALRRRTASASELIRHRRAALLSLFLGFGQSSAACSFCVGVATRVLLPSCLACVQIPKLGVSTATHSIARRSVHFELFVSRLHDWRVITHLASCTCTPYNQVSVLAQDSWHPSSALQTGFAVVQHRSRDGDSPAYVPDAHIPSLPCEG